MNARLSDAPSPALRNVLNRRGVEPLSDVWHRAAFYERPGNNFPPEECVERAIQFVVRDPDRRFSWTGDLGSGTLTCVVCHAEIFVTHPTAERIDAVEADHWDTEHRAQHGA